MDNLSKKCSRRRFLAGTTALGALYAARKFTPFSVFAQSIPDDPRIATQPVADEGYALVRKIGNGVYATISDRSKGMQTRSNGGFIVGRDGALLVEGFQTPIGASFQMDALRMVSKLPVRAAIDTHWHFDHTMGNSFYTDMGIPVWAHPKAAGYIQEKYTRWHAEDLAAFLAPWEQRVSDAKTDSLREHAKSDVEGVRSLYEPNGNYPLALPTHPLDPATMPLKVDLGGLTVVIENYIGHTDTDLLIRVPDQNIAYMGDLLVNMQYPTNINGYPTQWRATLAKIAKFDKNTLFIPGHGQICGMETLATMRAIFDDIAEQAEKMYKAGVPVEDATERYVVPEKWKNYRQFSWGFCVGRTIEQLYAEWSGKPVKVLNYS